MPCWKYGSVLHRRGPPPVTVVAIIVIIVVVVVFGAVAIFISNATVDAIIWESGEGIDLCEYEETIR